MQIKTFEAQNKDGSGTHKISYTDIGESNAAGDNFVVCVHGLTRNGRDFDFVAKRLAKNFRVICPDMPGRGKSAWFADAKHYDNEIYIADTLALMESVGAKKMHWIGTSMGGLMGMVVACLQPQLLHKMVLNDIGAFISEDGMRRIKKYVAGEVKFANREHAQKRFREIFAPFKIETEEQWQHMFEHGLRVTDDEQFSFNHDPKLGEAFIAAQDIDLWRVWEAVQVPTLLIRGAESDILPRNVAERMAQKAGVQFAEFAGFGHVPPLMNDAQIGVVERFLI